MYIGSLAARMTTAVGISDALDVVGKIPWHQAMKASVVSTANLKSMYSGDRSQCRSRSFSVTCSYREDRCISLAAALSTD